MNIQLKLAFRYLSGRKLRSFLTTLSVIFGVMILFGMNGLLKPVVNSYRSNMVAAVGVVDLTVTHLDNIPFETSMLDTVRSVPGIAQATGILRRSVILPTSLGGNSSDPLNGVSSVTVSGLDPETAPAVRSYVVSKGRFLQSGDTGVAAIPISLATKLNLSLGDTITLPSAEGSASFEIVGILEARSTPGNEEVFIPLADAQVLMNQPGRINAIEGLFEANIEASTIETAVQDAIGPNYSLAPSEVGTELLSALRLGETMFLLFGVMALAMGAFIILNTFRTVIAERRHDLGLLRAIGASRRTVLGIFLFESLIQGILGTALGLLCGWLLAAGLLASIAPMMSTFLHISTPGPEFTLINFVQAILLGIGFTVASAFFPALSAARITPMEALRPESTQAHEVTARRRAILGAVLFGISIVSLVTGDTNIIGIATLFFLTGLVLLLPAIVKPIADTFGRLLDVIFKREGIIARGNLSRQPGRASVTASAMMIGLAILITMAGFMTTIREGFMRYMEKSLGADYIILPTSMVLGGGNLGATPELAQKIGELDGVAGVTTLRQTTTNAGDLDLQLVGIDPQVFPQISGLDFSKGDEAAAYAALGNSRSLIVNGIFSSQNNVKVGDVLTLTTAEGEQQYTVVAVAIDYLNAKLATAYISQANLEQDFHQDTDLLILANKTPEADHVATMNAIEALLQNYPTFTLYDWATFKATQMSTLDLAMGMLYVLMIALAAPGLIAMVNTLAINVIERRREFGMLRAVGSTQKQVRRMVLAESLLLASLGAITGIVMGLWLSYLSVQAMNSSGFPLTYFFPLAGVLVCIAVSILFGIIAAGVPARQASEIDIVTALRYE